MEAVPKLSMLHFDLKYSPENTDFLLKLKKLIHTHYQEDPDSFSKELSEIGTLRSNACIRPTQDFAGISSVKKYFCQLNFLQNRFKIRGGTEDGIFAFPWYDVYSGALYTFSDLHYEMASVLYNIGALHSALGSREDRSSSEGMKVACTHFQCAAWSFHTLPDRFHTDAGTDMAPDLLAFLSQVCLAQAQECILEKSILDHRKSSIIAKVGAQVADYYKQAFRKIESSNSKADSLTAEETIAEVVGSKLSKAWTKYCEFKMVYYSAVSYLYMGIQAEESQKMGERITYYEKASELLIASGKLTKNLDNDVISKNLLTNCLTFSSDVINGKLEISKKENEFVYHEKVPDFDTLPELKGASLVRGIGFEVSDPEISGPDIFGRLVPLEAHETSSMYSEVKAQLLRNVGAEIESKNSTLEVFLSSLSLSEVPKPGDHLSMPQELIEAAAGLSVQKEDVVKKLVEAMASIAAVAADVEANLRQIREYLEDEETQVKEYNEIVGERPSPLNSDLERECEKYEEAHHMASESNATLHNAMRLHIDNLRLLAKPLDQLQKEIPSLADLDEGSEANIAEVHRLLAKVEEMKAQRATLMEQFRAEVHEDDITKKLVLHKDKEIEEVFQIELKKHEAKRKIIGQNLLAQDNILQALTETNARYASTRRIVAELINARTELIGSLVASFYAYDDLLQKASKGLEFYTKLNSNVQKLLNRVKGFCKVQQEERDAVLAKHHDQAAKKMSKPAEVNVNRGFENYAPGAPPFHDNLDDIEPNVPIVMGGVGAGAGGGRPTLKDYLDMMKANKMPLPGKASEANPSNPPQNSTRPYSSSEASPSFSNKVNDQQPQPAFQTNYQYPGPGGYPNYPGMQQPYYPTSASTAPMPTTSQPSSTTSSGEGNANQSMNTQSVQSNPENSGAGRGQQQPQPPPNNPSAYPSNQSGYLNQQQQPSIRMPTSTYQAPQAPLSSYQAPNTQVPTSSTYQQPVVQPSSAYQSHIPSHFGGPPNSANPHQYSMYMPQPGVGQSPYGNAPAQSTVATSSVSSVPAYHYPQGQVSVQSTIASGYQYPQGQPTTSTANTNIGYQNQQGPGQPTGNSSSADFNPSYPYPQGQMPGQPGVVASTAGSYPGYNYPQGLAQSIASVQYNQQIPQGQNLSYPGALQQPVTSKPSPYQAGPGHLPAQQAPQGQVPFYPTHPQQSQIRPQVAGQPVNQQFQYPQGQTQQPGLAGQRPVQPDLNFQQPFPAAGYGSTSQQNPNSLAYSSNAQPAASQPLPQQPQPQMYGYAPSVTMPNTNTSAYPQTSYHNVPSSTPGSTPMPTIHGQQAQITNTATAAGGTRPTATIQPSSVPSTLHQGAPVPGYSYQPQQQIPGASIYQSAGPLQQIYTSTVLYPLPIEPKLRAVVPQPGTVPSQMTSQQFGSGPQQYQSPIPATVRPSLQPLQPMLPSTVGRSVQSVPLNSDFHRRTSLEEMLGDEPKANAESSGVLQPKVMTASELEELKKEAQARDDIAKACAKDPYESSSPQQKLLSELNLLEALINDKATLDLKWKEVLTMSEIYEVGTKRTVSVARCYPMKNRAPDVLPFDQTRVELPSTKDDYINASRVKQLTTHSPKFVATQAPTAHTMTDFWMMVWQEQVETLVCLVPDVKEVYWPTERREPLKILKTLEVTLQSTKNETFWTEKIFTLLNKETNTSRVVIHLQLNPNASSNILESTVLLASTSLNYHRQQRVLTHPVVVHCLTGSGKTALFILIAAAMAEVNLAGGNSDTIIPDMVQLASTLSQQRKGILRDKEHFRQALQGVAKHARDLLVKKGVIEPTPIVRHQEPKPTDAVQFESNLSLLASQFGFDISSTKSPPPSTLEHSTNFDVSSTQEVSTETKKTEGELKAKFFTSDLSRLADLSLDPFSKSSDVGDGATGSPRRKKITKQDFLNADKNKNSGILKSENNPDDPLSQLDPLWSLK